MNDIFWEKDWALKNPELHKKLIESGWEHKNLNGSDAYIVPGTRNHYHGRKAVILNESKIVKE